MANETENSTAVQKITLDLTPQAAAELERIRDKAGVTKAELFRHAFSLLRIYVKAVEDGQELCIIDPKGKDKVIQLPISF